MTKYWIGMNKGDTACIIAPSYGVNDNVDISFAINEAKTIVESYNLTALMYPNLISPGNHTLFINQHLRFSNSDEVKVTQLIAAFNNPDCDLVWAFKGGYGAIRLINALSKEEVPQMVKPFVGFSDITILHSYINDVWGWPSIHFGMPGALPKVMQKEDTKNSFQDIIFDQKNSSFTLDPLNHNLLHDLKIDGITSGGNLLSFDKLLGTKYSPSLSNKIIIFEDVEEPIRKLDGFLQKLTLISDFEEISAIVFATFSPFEDQPMFDKIFKDFADNINVPVFQMHSNNTVGHGDINNALPLGVAGEINCNGYCQLDIISGGLTVFHIDYEGL